MFSYMRLGYFCFFLILLQGCTGSHPFELDQVLIEKDVEIYIQQQLERSELQPDDAYLYFKLSKAYLHKQWYTEAEKYARRAIQFDLQNAEYIELLGNIMLLRQRYGEALNAFTIAIEADDDRLVLYVRLALTYEKMGDDEKAIAALEEVLLKDLDYVEALYHLARLSLKKHQLDQALPAINSLLKLEPSNLEASILEIRILAEQQNYYMASARMKRLLHYFPNTYLVQHEALRLAVVQKKWEKALVHIRQLEEAQQLQIEDRIIYAHVLIQQGKMKEAKVLLFVVLEEDSLRTESMLTLALVYIHLGDSDQALLWLQRSTEVDNRSAKAHFMKASIYFKKNNFLEGDLALNRAVELDPLNRDIKLLSLRRRLLNTGEETLVTKELDEFLKAHPGDAEILRFQSDLLVMQRNYRAAEALLRKIQVIADTDLIQYSLARVFYLQNQHAQTLSITQHLSKKFPNDWEILYLHLLTLNQLGKYNEAQILGKSFLEKEEGRGFIHRLIGDMYRYQDNPQEAQKIYQRGLDLFPGHLGLIEALSSSYMLQGQWQDAKKLLEGLLEQKGELPPLLLDRFILVTRQLGDLKKTLSYLKMFNQQNDPVTHARSFDLESQLMFPLATPGLGYKELSFSLLRP